jgi:hypothetical protein
LSPFECVVITQQPFKEQFVYQNHLLSYQQVIAIHNIGVEAMYYLIDRIRAITGVIDVIATKKVDATGRYHVLVNKETFNKFETN